MENVWSELDGKPYIVGKLPSLWIQLKEWNHSLFGNLDRHIDSFYRYITDLEVVAKSSLFSEDEKKLLERLKLDLWTIKKRLESLWIQKARLTLPTKW